MYHFTSVLSKSELPDFYGAGALPINYPNEWDRLNGRTGHGIWLHGTPADTYAISMWTCGEPSAFDVEYVIWTRGQEFACTRCSMALSF